MQIETANDFGKYTLSKGLVNAISSANYSSPTPVQHSTIPLIVAGLDLIVQSQTGTGKTAAFVIPIIELLDSNPGTLEVLFLAPTRELAKQVGDEFKKFGEHKKIEVTTIYGGSSYEKQYEALETAQIVTATPGRLIDLIERGKVDLSKLRVFGLDEADEMLSMGFQEEVDKVIRKLPENRQSLLFSATITPEVRSLGKSMLYYPEFITHSDESVTADNVKHIYYPISGVGRVRELVRVLEFADPENAIIFANTKDDTFMISRYLTRCGFRVAPLNGDLAQTARERTLADLKSRKIDFIIATDVAARGIDISELEAVINYQVSESAEVYVHRTGRTGRAGRKGTAISLVAPGERATLFSIKKLYDVPLKEKPLPTTQDLVLQKQKNLIRNLTRKGSSDVSESFVKIARRLVEDPSEENILMIAELLRLASSKKQAKSYTKKVDATTTRTQESTADEGGRRTKAPRTAQSLEDETVRKQAPPRTPRGEKSNSDSRAGKPSHHTKQNREKSRDESRNRKTRNSNPKKNDRKDRDSKGRSDRSKNRNDRKPKNDRSSSPKKNRSEKDTFGASRAEKEKNQTGKIWVNIGKSVSDSKEDFIEVICDLAGVMPEDINGVQIDDAFSFIEVRKDYLFDIIKAMNNQEYKGLTITAQQARK